MTTVLAGAATPDMGKSQLPSIAALSMYDLPELQAANDALWAAIRDRLAELGVHGAPDGLTRREPVEAVWTNPDLLLAQACGYPLVTTLAGRVRLVATPRYAAEGCEGPLRRSVMVVASGATARTLGDLRGTRCAINDLQSDSGMNLLRAAIAPLAGGASFFQAVEVTGSHLASAHAVASGACDLAALDCVTYAHLQRFRPELAGRLRVLGWTDPTPGLPLITALRTDQKTRQAMVQALDDVARDPALSEVRDVLMLEGFSALPLSQYQAVIRLEERAAKLRYPVVC